MKEEKTKSFQDLKAEVFALASKKDKECPCSSTCSSTEKKKPERPWAAQVMEIIDKLRNDGAVSVEVHVSAALGEHIIKATYGRPRPVVSHEAKDDICGAPNERPDMRYYSAR